MRIFLILSYSLNARIVCNYISNPAWISTIIQPITIIPNHQAITGIDIRHRRKSDHIGIVPSNLIRTSIRANRKVCRSTPQIAIRRQATMISCRIEYSICTIEQSRISRRRVINRRRRCITPLIIIKTS